MELLYVSVLSTERLINDIYKNTGQNPGFAIQKFSRLLVTGIKQNDVKVNILSSPPFFSKKCSKEKKWIRLDDETEGELVYKYVPYLNIPILKNFCVLFFSFFYVLFWGLTKRKEKVVICDVLTIGLSLGALLATKLNRVRSVGLVTDIFDLMVGAVSLKAKVAAKLNQQYVKSFDKYILLTEQMNEKVNPLKRPYIVIEGVCDNSSIHFSDLAIEKKMPRVVLYAGGIYEEYGLKMLAEAFLKADINDAKLVYYGSGPYVPEYKLLCAKHSNLEYRGVATNDVIVREEYAATLLVNPRFASEEFTKYSFPSKNMEFMVSGTPLLTTKLPGMPMEYYPYVYLFTDESIDGYAKTLKQVLSCDTEELIALGAMARKFVLSNKNNIYQGKCIVNFLSNN